MLRLGYNTNGFNCHSLESALEVISSLGSEGVAISLDNYILNPWNSDLNTELDLVERRLNQYSLSCDIETGAGFLLNPRHKHEPTLISKDAEGRKTRLKFLKKALIIAGRLNGEALSFWSGKKQDTVDDRTAWKWLISGCRELSNDAEKFNVPLAFEPEPGMFIENPSEFHQSWRQRLSRRHWTETAAELNSRSRVEKPGFGNHHSVRPSCSMNQKAGLSGIN